MLGMIKGTLPKGEQNHEEKESSVSNGLVDHQKFNGDPVNEGNEAMIPPPLVNLHQ